jgi:imidazolonepropionase-like amidohydrolase
MKYLLLLLAAAGQLIAQQRPIAFTGATMIDGIGKRPLTDVLIIIDHGLVVGVGEKEFVVIPPDAEVIDLHGKIIMPGIVDVHVHDHTPAELRSMFAWGVTSANCMFGSTDAATAMERMAAGDSTPLPRVFPTAPVFAADARWYGDGFADSAINRFPKTAEEAREQVRKAKAKGMVRIEVVDDGMEWARGTLKPLDRLLPEVVNALIDEAAQQEMKVGVHAPSFRAAEAAQRAGVFAFNEGVIDEYLDAPFISNIPTKPEFYVPTLSRYAFYADVEQFVKRVLSDKWFRSSLSDSVIKSCTSPAYASRFRGQVPDSASLKRRQSLVRDNMTAIVNNFGNVSLGTDLPDFPGIAAHVEMEEMVKAGLTPMQALALATTLGGQYLGISSGVGSIYLGAKADLLILDADPTLDIRNTRSIRTVVKGGIMYDHNALLKQAGQ